MASHLGSAIDEVRDILVDLARKKQTIFYGELCAQVKSEKLIANGSRLAALLTEISRQEHVAGRPLLSVLVVNKRQRIPSAPFFLRAREICGARIARTEDFFLSECDAVFGAWGAPRNFFPQGRRR